MAYTKDTAKTFLALLLLSLPITSGCSSHGASSTRNTVSPYDTEFDPDVNENEASADGPIPEELEALGRAKDAFDHGLYSVARQYFMNIRDQYPGSYYSTLAELKIADTQFFSGNYPEAITGYEEFIKLHPAHEAVSYARFQIGAANKLQYTGPERDQSPLIAAIKSFEQLLTTNPNMPYSLQARRALDDCRELMAKHEAYVARFYFNQGMYEASASRVAALSGVFPDTAAARTSDETNSDSVTAPSLASVLTKAQMQSQGGGWEQAAEERQDSNITTIVKSPPNLSVAHALPPQIPTVLGSEVIAESNSKKMLQSARARLGDTPADLQLTKIENNENKEETAVSEEEKSYLALRCEELGADAAITTYLAPGVTVKKIASQEEGNETEAIFLLLPATDSKINDQTSLTFSCPTPTNAPSANKAGTITTATISGCSAKETSAEIILCGANSVAKKFGAKSDEGKTFAVRISTKPGISLTPLIVDRPSRLLVVGQRRTGRP